MNALHRPSVYTLPILGVAALAAGFLVAPPFLFLAVAFANAFALALWCFGARIGSIVALAAAMIVAVASGLHAGGDTGSILFPLLGGTGVAGLALLHLIEPSSASLSDHEEREERLATTKTLQRDIAYYEERAIALAARGQQRRQLAGAARDFGALLDPAAIQAKLVETALALFPQQPVSVSTSQTDNVDGFVFQRRQAIMVPSDGVPGAPALAAPICAQRSVVGVVRVGGDDHGRGYTRDDLRLLDVLASLASLALDNCALVNQARQSALRDNLTGLLTHRAFQEQLDLVVLEASRYNQPFSILFADVDHFKSVNDRYGHPMGDQILQGFAHVMDRNVRDVDVVARYGGEEFAIILLQTSYLEALATAERMRADLNEQSFDSGKGPFSISASFGVASFPEDATSAQQLVRQADQRLYEAKRGGRNRVRGRTP